MCTLLVSVVDKMLETEAVVKDHPPLAGTLRASVAKFLNLAKKASDAGYCQGPMLSAFDTPPPPEGNKVCDGDSPGPGVPALDPPSSSSSSNSSSPGGSSRDSSAQKSVELDGRPPVIQNEDMYLDPPGQSLPLGGSGSKPYNPGIMTRVLSNGWVDYTTTHRSVPMKLPPTILEAFTLRLLRTTLFRGYLVLSGTPDYPMEEYQRVFGGAVRVRSREEILSGIRFVLGPGQDHIYRASGYSWDLPTMVRNAGLDKDGTEYLTTADIQSKLLGLGAKMVDADTMEVPKPFHPEGEGEMRHAVAAGSALAPAPSPAPALAPGAAPPPRAVAEEATMSADAAGSLTVPDPMGFIDFFALHRPVSRGRPARTARIHVPTLVAMLSRSAVCVSRGPVFPRKELWAAMELSAETPDNMI